MEFVGQLVTSIVFPVKLIIGFAYFMPMLRRRSCFWLRAVLCIAITLSLSLGFYQLFADFNFTFLLNLAQFALFVVSVFACFRASVTQVCFFTGLALAIQQIAFNVLTLLYIPAFYISGLYTELGPVMQTVDNLFNFVHIGFAALAFWLFTKFILGRYVVTEEVIVKNKAVILIDFALILSIFILFHLAYRMLSPLMTEGTAFVFLHLYALITVSCVLAVGYFISIFKKEQTDVEVETMQRILRENSAQHNIFKENVDIINRKCHDIKFMLSSLSAEGHDAYIEELKHAVGIYEATPKTGNMVLDVVLSENILRAKEAGVELSCIADGKLLDFIEEADLYALFGNIISNALEAAVKADGDKRYIDLFVGELKGDLVSITAENGYSGEIELKNGLPQTSKGDTANHGFGMKSIDYIVKKYGGGLDIRLADHVFKISIVFEKDSQAEKA